MPALSTRMVDPLPARRRSVAAQSSLKATSGRPWRGSTWNLTRVAYSVAQIIR